MRREEGEGREERGRDQLMINNRLIIREEGVFVPDFFAFVKPPISPNKNPIYTEAIKRGI